MKASRRNSDTAEKKTTTLTKRAVRMVTSAAKKLKVRFVWCKKIERDVVRGLPLDHFTLKAEKKRLRERRAEIQKVQKRREQRALERACFGGEEEKPFLEADDIKKKEEEFCFSQSRLRSIIRLQEGRPKPIDILTTYHLEDPYAFLKGLTASELESLRDDIQMHFEMDRETPTHVQYWEAIWVLCDWELAQARRKGSSIDGRGNLGIHSSVETDVWSLLQGKSYEELVNLQSEIESDMLSGEAKVVEYWEDVLQRLPIFKAKACLKEIQIHASMLIKPDESKESKPDEHCMEAPMKTQDSEDNYCTRKPKYMNRAHTGYEWNKYNRTHYDNDNPPPKAVQGYKFNLFYPDLLDKTKPPVYTIEKDGASSETCIIRFHAGPPYEDIAFKIVNREWEHSPKNGFRYTFDGRILQVHFNFKRYRYKR